ncbi:RidA family protein [soil metagenome]
MQPTPTSRLRDLGYELPDVPQPAGSYVPAVVTGSLIFTAGQLPFQKGSLLHTGKVDDTVRVEEAQDAARLCALNALAALSDVVGLDEIGRIVKVTGYVASSDGFVRQPEVLNGASNFLGEIFGDTGVHVRSAVGVAQLPLDAPVEVEVIAEVKGR